MTAGNLAVGCAWVDLVWNACERVLQLGSGSLLFYRGFEGAHWMGRGRSSLVLGVSLVGAGFSGVVCVLLRQRD
jgi:hypothetical protein